MRIKKTEMNFYSAHEDGNNKLWGGVEFLTQTF